MSGSDAPPAPQTYQFENQSGADQGAYSRIGEMGNAPNYGQQAYDAFAPGLYGSSGASGWNPQDTVNAGNYITSSAAPLASYGFNLLDQGMDPQNALYDRTQQQLQDQVRAGQASRGIAMTPYGAGLENKAMGDFNIDWRNSQVQRGAQAAQGAAPLFQQMDRNVVTGQQLAMQAPELQMRMMGGLQSGGLGTQAQPQQVLDNLFRYLSGGNAADNTAVNRYGQEVRAWQAEEANNAAMMQGIGQLAGNALMFMSDRRLKTDIRLHGAGSYGLPLYRFRYVWGPEEFIGYMADEVEKVVPEAVVTLPSGYKAVDYAKV